MGLAAFTQPVVTDMLAAAALLSPISYLDHITSAFINVAAHHYIDKMVKTMGVREFNLRNEVGVRLMDYVCERGDVDSVLNGDIDDFIKEYLLSRRAA